MSKLVHMTNAIKTRYLIVPQPRRAHARPRPQQIQPFRAVMSELHESFPIALLDDYLVTEWGTEVFLYPHSGSAQTFPCYAVLPVEDVVRLTEQWGQEWWLSIKLTDDFVELRAHDADGYTRTCIRTRDRVVLLTRRMHLPHGVFFGK